MMISFLCLALLCMYMSLLASKAVAATGVPKILNYQGRLMDTSGTVLGGTGTNFCFQFSLYDNSVVGSGSKLWPAATPSTVTISVKNGVFNAGIGDTSAGGDTLDYNFQDSDTTYLNVDVATKVGLTCAPGDGAEVYESLSPRQRLLSSAYAVNASTVGGYVPSQNASGNQVPVLVSGNLILGGVNPILSATTTNALIIQGSGTGDVRFFNSNNRINSTGNMTLGGSFFLANGTATTSLQSGLTGTSTLQGFLNVLGANSTSTFSGGLSVQSFAVTGSATSTFANGLSLAGGCFSVNGTCIATGFATSSADYYVNASSTIPKTYTANSFTATQTFINASTTNISASYASSTQGFFGSLSVGSLSGILKATAGAIGTSLVNLAADVTGFLGVINGGTGTSTAPAYGQVLLGNATGGYDLVATSSLGVTVPQDGTFSTTSADYYAHSSTTISKTYTANIFSALQRFGNASTTLLSISNGVSTTSIFGHATSTFGAGIQATALSIIGAATSSLAGGINLATGCYSQNGTCIGAGSTVVLSAVRTGTATTTWSVPTGLVYAVVELWGAGGGGGGGGATGGTGGTGASSNFGSLATSSGGAGGGGGGTVRAGGLGGTAVGGNINLPGMPGQGGGIVTVSGSGGSATRGGDGGVGIASAISVGTNGDVYGGGGAGGGNTTGTRTGAGGGGGGFLQKTFTSGDLIGTTSVQVGVGVGGAAGVGGGTGPSNGGTGGAGGYIIYEYTTSNVSVGNGSVNTGSSGQVAFYNANGTAVSGQALLYADTVNGRIGISSSTPMAELAVVGSAIVTGRITTTDIMATGTLSVSGQSTFTNASTTNISAVYASSTQGFFGSLFLGSVSGILKATAGAISNSLVNLASDITGVLGIANGGTGWANLAANTLLTGNGSGALATTTVGSSLQLSGGTLALNVGNANLWSGLQSFANASTSLQSVFTKAYFGGTATTTIDSAGNIFAAGTLSVAGGSTFAGATSTSLAVTGSTTVTGQFNAQGGAAVSTITGSGAATFNTTLAVIGLTTLANASTTLLSVVSGNATTTIQAQATSTFGAGIQTSALSITGLSGILKAVAGYVSTSLVSLTSDITGVLNVANGGTGWASLTANTLLTGNGSGGIATTSIASSLQLSGNSLALNVANPNLWTGLQTFTNASTTLLESMIQFARTIQSTSTNALMFKTNFTSTAGLTLGATTSAMVTLDTLNNRVSFGSGGSANPTLFVADTGNSTDPTGVNGSMYYSSTFGSFRCFENSAWRSCGGQATSTAGDIQFKNSDGAFKATTNFNWSLASNGLTIKGNAGQLTDLLAVASSTGAVMFGISSAGVLEMATTTTPAAPASGLNLYAKEIAGRVFPTWIGPAGIENPGQSSFGFNRVSMVMPSGNGTTTSFATSPTSVGSLASPALASTNMLTSIRRVTYSTTAVAGTLASQRQSAGMVWRGTGPGLGGFFYTIRFGISALQVGNRAFVGLADTFIAPTNVDPTTNITPGKVGMAINANTGNWKFVWNVTGSAPTVSDLGATIPVNATDMYELAIFSKSNGAAITWRVTDLSTGAQVSSTTATTNIPATTTFLAPQFWMTNNATAAIATMDFAGWYLESDN